MPQNNGKQTIKITYDSATVKFMVLKKPYGNEEENRFNKYGREYSPKGIGDVIFQLISKGTNIIIDPYILPEIRSELEKYLQQKQSPLEKSVSQSLQ